MVVVFAKFRVSRRANLRSKYLSREPQRQISLKRFTRRNCLRLPALRLIAEDPIPCLFRVIAV